MSSKRPLGAVAERLAAAAFGILLALVGLELALRGAAAVLQLADARRVAAPGIPVSACRILCIGESMTAPSGLVDESWPRQLEGLLNREAPGRFAVINMGRKATTSSDIALRLPGELDKYRPRLVIAMMGRNDRAWFGVVEQRGTLATRFRSLRLYRLLRYVYHEGFFKKSAVNPEAPPPNDLDREARALIVAGRLDEARALGERVAKGPRAAEGLALLAEVASRRGQVEEAIGYCRRSLALQPDPGLYDGLGDLYRDAGRIPEARSAYLKALELGLKKDLTRAKLAAIYLREGRKAEAERLYSDAGWDVSIRHLATEEPVSRANYRKVRELVESAGAALVAVQYPLQDANELRTLFEGNPGVMVVDNERNFRAALAAGRYEDYFTDHAGGAFGHFTPKGARLIAERIAAALAPIVKDPPGRDTGKGARP